jgi:hypothetical protein
MVNFFLLKLTIKSVNGLKKLKKNFLNVNFFEKFKLFFKSSQKN